MKTKPETVENIVANGVFGAIVTRLLWYQEKRWLPPSQTVDQGSDPKDEVQGFFYAHDICDFINIFIKNADMPEYTGTFCPCFSL